MTIRRRARDLPYVVEGRTLPVPSDADCVPWNPIARFQTEEYARWFMRDMAQYNAESAMIDRVHYRLKNVNKVIV